MATTPLKDISRLFFPNVCAVCSELLPDGGDFICTKCRWEIPLTGFWNKIDNPVTQVFYGHIPIINASSFFYFIHDSGFQSLIHTIKYRSGWRYAIKSGKWFGSELAESSLYQDIDVIVPIPLHFRKRLKRGYNQAEYIAKGIGESLQVEVDSKSVIRTVHNPSQTTQRHSERWGNVEGIFSVRSPEKLKGKHILLVDDVLTTGATIISCGETIIQSVPDCQLSIATLAAPRDLDKVSKVYSQY